MCSFDNPTCSCEDEVEEEFNDEEATIEDFCSRCLKVCHCDEDYDRWREESLDY